MAEMLVGLFFDSSSFLAHGNTHWLLVPDLPSSFSPFHRFSATPPREKSPRLSSNHASFFIGSSPSTLTSSSISLAADRTEDTFSQAGNDGQEKIRPAHFQRAASRRVCLWSLLRQLVKYGHVFPSFNSKSRPLVRFKLSSLFLVVRASRGLIPPPYPR